MKKLIIITGPSATGKTYLAHALLEQFPQDFEQAKLFTTRSPRPSEIAPDRLFVSETEFASKMAADEFIIADQFHDNWYGYTSASLQPTSKHLLVNTWPALLPKFKQIDRAVWIGLTVSQQNMDTLENRMAKRGDTSRIIKERLELIEKDMAELVTLTDLVNEKGKVFSITNDSTIPNEVIPWLKERLQIN